MRIPATGESLRSRRREMLALALPAMGALALDPLLSLVDTALVGRLGTVSLAALGIDAAVFTTLFWLFNFLVYGTTSAVARLHARDDEPAAAARIVQACWLAVVLGVVVTVALLLAGPLVVGAMGARGAVRDPALDYLRVRALAAVPALIVMVGHGAFRGLKDTRTPLAVTLALNVCDAALSWVLIYPAGLGVAGAAWGTVAAQSGAALVFLVLLRRRLPLAALGPSVRAMGAILTVSRDLFLRTLALLTGMLLATAAAARMGAEVVAAHQIAREVWLLLALVLDGFAIAAQALVAASLGAGEPDRARQEARALLRWGIATGIGLGVAQLALTGVLPAVFTDEAAVLDQVRGVWWIVAVLQPLGAVVFVLDGVFMGAHDYRFLLLTTAASALGVLAPVAFLALRLDWGLAGVWAGMSGLIVVRLVLLGARLRQWDKVAAAAA